MNDELKCTPANLAALAAIREFRESHGTGPTIRELAHRLKFNAPSAVSYHVHRLAALGLVTYKATGAHGQLAARSLQLTEDGARALARREKRRVSRMFVGERALALNADELAAARRAGVPLSPFRHTRRHIPPRDSGLQPRRTLIQFADRADRDFWGNLILDELGQFEAAQQQSSSRIFKTK